MVAKVIELFTRRAVETPRRRSVTAQLVELMAQCAEDEDDFAFECINTAWARIQIHNAELKAEAGQ